VNGLKHQKEKRSMDRFAGLDVSVKETSVCIVDEMGKMVREVEVASEPEALLAQCRFRREARARERHQHPSGGWPESA